ncbi:hypothetical protein [Dyadobacter sediminis]|uniref:PAS domain-containing protein n=1 Tax=Dyadobacter sediminis TaxID=1493691 RepID=A0A5R9KBA4_9BACT|nr:hypothetical protein [Dyadobacter sediminis]TLU92054.1 hypothetical protein FEM55_14985 [Dyadobacter sediminis]
MQRSALEQGLPLFIRTDIDPESFSKGKVQWCPEKQIDKNLCCQESQIDAAQKQILDFFEESPVSIALIDAFELTYTMANAFYSQLVGRTPEQLVIPENCEMPRSVFSSNIAAFSSLMAHKKLNQGLSARIQYFAVQTFPAHAHLPTVCVCYYFLLLFCHSGRSQSFFKSFTINSSLRTLATKNEASLMHRYRSILAFCQLFRLSADDYSDQPDSDRILS